MSASDVRMEIHHIDKSTRPSSGIMTIRSGAPWRHASGHAPMLARSIKCDDDQACIRSALWLVS